MAVKNNRYTENISADANLTQSQRDTIQGYREQAKSGQISWDQANAAANQIRQQSGGYTVDKNGTVTRTPGNSFSSGASGSGASGGGYSGGTSGWTPPSNYTENISADSALSQDILDAIQGYREQAKSGQISWDMANQLANALRAQYGGYIVDKQGNRTSLFPEIPEFQFPEAPSYTPMYDALMNSQLQEILGSSFQDWAQGSDYQYLYDKYAGNGQKAMQDVLGQLAARTGGYASSYATAAAGQSYNDYMATLEDAARAMYQDQLQQQMQNLGLLTEAENNNYTQYLNALNQWNTDRSQAYNQYLNNLNWQYQMNRDQIEDQRYNSETAYGKEQDAWEREQYENEAALDRAILAAQYGDYSGLTALGINPNMALLTSSGRSSGGSKSSPSSEVGKPRLTAAQTLAALESGLRNQQVLDAYEYYYGEPFADAAPNFTTYQEAADYIRKNGGQVSGLMTSSEWARHKNNKNDQSGASQYSTYSDYLNDYVSYILS